MYVSIAGCCVRNIGGGGPNLVFLIGGPSIRSIDGRGVCDVNVRIRGPRVDSFSEPCGDVVLWFGGFPLDCFCSAFLNASSSGVKSLGAAVLLPAQPPPKSCCG